MAKIRANLRHESTPWPFLYLAPNFDGPGKVWWQDKLKQIIAKFDEHTVAPSILNVAYFPYPSPRFLNCGRVPSQEYSFHLVQEAMKRECVIVRMRRRKNTWFEAVPGLETYPKLCELKNTQRPCISSGNCTDFEKVVAAIQDFRERSFRQS